MNYINKLYFFKHESSLLCKMEIDKEKLWITSIKIVICFFLRLNNIKISNALNIFQIYNTSLENLENHKIIIQAQYFYYANQSYLSLYYFLHL